MSILVTGGAGYIGSHMALRLLSLGEAVVILDNLSTGQRALIPKTARFVEGDIADRVLLDGLMGDGAIEAVIHFAGSIVVPESVTEPLAYYHNNTVKSRGLIEACVAHGVPRIIFTSCSSGTPLVSVNAAPSSATARILSPG